MIKIASYYTLLIGVLCTGTVVSRAIDNGILSIFDIKYIIFLILGLGGYIISAFLRDINAKLEKNNININKNS